MVCVDDNKYQENCKYLTTYYCITSTYIALTLTEKVNVARWEKSRVDC